jgi:predicted Zn-dependent protease
MKVRTPFFAVCCSAATALSLAVAGCSSADSRAKQAFIDYQAASAAGDLNAARIALLQLVGAKDDDPSYWQDLGKVQLQLGAYSDAYYAYNRARELDKSDVTTLASLTQLALLSGNMGVAERHARQLDLLAPNHPAAKLAFGYAALRRQDMDEADRQADALLQSYPFEGNAKLLKARILLSRGEHDQAIALLEAQIKAKPDDLGALNALAAMHRRDSDWRGVLTAAKRMHEVNPKNPDTGLMAVEAAFQANDVAEGKRLSAAFLRPEAQPVAVDSVLRIWAQRWKSPQSLELARSLAAAAPRNQQIAYATYFNEAGSPRDAMAIVGESPLLPVTIANMSRNSIIADSLALIGHTSEAKRLFDAILAKEPDHVNALRGRINLEIRTGRAKAAITDAQRLVSILPGSARDRLLLARAFAVSGDKRQVDRALWDGFHAIPANFEMYEALRSQVEKTAGVEAARAVDAEFSQQRETQLSREFI